MEWCKIVWLPKMQILLQFEQKSFSDCVYFQTSVAAVTVSMPLSSLTSDGLIQVVGGGEGVDVCMYHI